MTRLEILETIKSQDPDGKPSFPKQEDYARFESWVKDRFGADMLKDYYTTSWGLGSLYE